MQYTIRRVPQAVDNAIRERARASGKSLNEAAVDALAEGAGVSGTPQRRRDLGDIAGTWKADKAAETALADQDRVDPSLWRCESPLTRIRPSPSVGACVMLRAPLSVRSVAVDEFERLLQDAVRSRSRGPLPDA